MSDVIFGKQISRGLLAHFLFQFFQQLIYLAYVVNPLVTNHEPGSTSHQSIHRIFVFS